MIKLPVALGLFSVRGTLFTDLDGTLAKVKDIGYDGVEFFGPLSTPAQTVRDSLDKHELKIFGWHVPLELLQGVNFDVTVAYMKAIGNNCVAVPYLGGDTEDAWKGYAQALSDVAAKLKPHGIFLGYHNHTHEFTPSFNGKRSWDILFDNASDDLFPQVDTGHVLGGGGDPLAEITRFAGRLHTIHYKPYKKDAPGRGMDTMFGVDDNKIKEMVEAAQNGGAVCHIIEYECEETYSQFGGAREALKAFRAASE